MEIEEIVSQYNSLQSPTYLSPNKIENRIEQVIPLALQFLENLDDNPFHRFETPQQVQEAIYHDLPTEGKDFEEIITFLQNKILTRFPSTNSKYFLGYIPSDPAPEAIIGSMLTGFFNQFTGSFQGSQGGTAIEALVILWIVKMLELPEETYGSFTMGGSGANLTCIYSGMVNQSKMHGIDIKNDGLYGNRRLLVYISDQTHNAVDKALMMLGVGRRNIRKVESDQKYRMRAEEVKHAIKQDIETYGDTVLPIMIVGTAGTTNTGSIDDLEGLHRIARRHKMWFHIDAAYGGFARMTDTPAAKKMRALRLADSIALDAHKWLYTPFEAGIALVRDHKLLRYAFELSAEYLKDSEFEEKYELTRNFRSYGFPLTRELRGLKLWFMMSSYGFNGLKNAITKDILRAEYLRTRLKNHNMFELIGETSLSVVCFRYIGSDEKNDIIIEKLQNQQKFYISRTSLRDLPVIRVAIINLRADLDLIDKFIEEMEEIISTML